MPACFPDSLMTPQWAGRDTGSRVQCSEPAEADPLRSCLNISCNAAYQVPVGGAQPRRGVGQAHKPLLTKTVQPWPRWHLGSRSQQWTRPVLGHTHSWRGKQVPSWPVLFLPSRQPRPHLPHPTRTSGGPRALGQRGQRHVQVHPIPRCLDAPLSAWTPQRLRSSTPWRPPAHVTAGRAWCLWWGGTPCSPHQIPMPGSSV